MSKNITLWGAAYSNVPSVLLPQTGGGTALFTDPSIVTAALSDVRSGKTTLLADGSSGTGTLTVVTYYTGSSAPSSSLGSDGDIYLQT